MRYTPVELRHVRLRRGLFGYRRSRVDELLAEVTESFEEVWSDRVELSDRVEQLEADVARHREVEELLRKTLVSAERAAGEAKDHARREAEQLLAEAHLEARSVSRNALAERERLLLDARRIRHLLEAALASVAEAQPTGEAPEAAAA